MEISKKNRIMQIVTGIFVIVAGIAFIFMGILIEDAFPVVFIAVFMIVSGPALIIVGALGLSKFKKIEKKAAALIKDAQSLAFLTYGGNSGYKHYHVVLDKDEQSSANVAKNVAGVASYFLLGVGIFSLGFDSIDCFVSKDEIILNDKKNNPGLQDELFIRLKTEKINDIVTETYKKYVKISIILSDGKKVVLHVPSGGGNAEIIQSDFSIAKKSIQ